MLATSIMIYSFAEKLIKVQSSVNSIWKCRTVIPKMCISRKDWNDVLTAYLHSIKIHKKITKT